VCFPFLYFKLVVEAGEAEAFDKEMGSLRVFSVSFGCSGEDSSMSFECCLCSKRALYFSSHQMLLGGDLLFANF
jgi:hypothetical protein